jgi:DNA-binding NarL/FixJ family response regulator
MTTTQHLATSQPAERVLWNTPRSGRQTLVPNGEVLPAVSAVLLHSGAATLGQLDEVLRDLYIPVSHVCSFEAARGRPTHPQPQILFMDVALANGNWREVLNGCSLTGTPLILVASRFDVPLFLDALEAGAANYITTPFHARDVAHIIRCACAGPPAGGGVATCPPVSRQGLGRNHDQ